jgi:hypothetical protein
MYGVCRIPGGQLQLLVAATKSSVRVSCTGSDLREAFIGRRLQSVRVSFNGSDLRGLISSEVNQEYLLSADVCEA